MLKSLVNYRETETLIPNTGLQYLDFGFNIEALEEKKLRGEFAPIFQRGQVDENNHELFHLRKVEKNEDEDYVAIGWQDEEPVFVDDDDVYSVKAEKVIDTLAQVWLPMPFFRLREARPGGQDIFADGPTNWARVYIAKLPEPDTEGNTHRVVMCFDTQLVSRQPEDSYFSPSALDAGTPAFGLVSDPLLNRNYLANERVRDWLKEAYAERLSEIKKRRIRSIDLHDPDNPNNRNLGEYWAAYHMVLMAIEEMCDPPQLKLIDTISPPQDPPVNVDLMIDIGNNRTCGMLVEEADGQSKVDISKPERMEIRDLNAPEHVYSDPIESWVEFFPADFGYDTFSRGAQRSKRPAFFWPSPVRVGPEAARLSIKSDGTEGVTGMSSPKRYLWDTIARKQAWSNNPSAPRPEGYPTPPIKGPFTARLTENGIPLSAARGKDRVVGFEPRYSRSSMYMFMVAEILLHVVSQINSIASRGQNQYAHIPRRLRTIALTLPSATPVAEQRLMKQNAKFALELVWQTMGWPTTKDVKAGNVAAENEVFTQPNIHLEWDEASCTHMVYLYNEIVDRFRDAPPAWFRHVSDRQNEKGEPAVRIASIDIGGGTTDLMIIQHESESRTIVHPKQLFREGFKQAGDDIVKSVIEKCVVPSITDALVAAGASSPYEIMPYLFGSEREGGTAAQRNQRALFVSQVLSPAATGLLERFEEVDLLDPPESYSIPLMDLLPEEFRQNAAEHFQVLSYVNAEAQNRGAQSFDLLKTSISFDVTAIRRAISTTMTHSLEHLCDVIRAYDCDVLLLTGRPTRLPVIREIILSQTPVPVHRIISLHDYEVGQWYPFRNPAGYISDPKTSVVVGAMLCKICEGGVEGFFMRASELRMRSTARYLGILGPDDRIKANEICTEDHTPDNVVEKAEFKIPMDSPFFIGFRQLPIERWPASPLMHVRFNTPSMGEKLNPPYTLTFERDPPRDDKDLDDLNESMEMFRLVDAIDANGDQALKDISASLQTLRTEQGAEASHWLDSGILDLSSNR